MLGYREIALTAAATIASKARVVTNESIANDGRVVPAALELPLNQIFLGYKYVPFDKSKVTKKVEPEDGSGVGDIPFWLHVTR